MLSSRLWFYYVLLDCALRTLYDTTCVEHWMCVVLKLGDRKQGMSPRINVIEENARVMRGLLYVLHTLCTHIYLLW
jgi:transposase